MKAYTFLNKNLPFQFSGKNDVHYITISVAVHLLLFFTLFTNSFNTEKKSIYQAYNQPMSFELTTSNVKTNSNFKKKVRLVPSQPKLIKDGQLSTKKATTKITQNSGHQQSKVSNVITKNFKENIINNTPPRYPSLAIRKGWQGKVLLSLLIAPDGKTTKVDILKPSNFPLLNKSAVSAALTWKFKPDINGKIFRIKKEIIFAIQ